jgi:LPXTG-motif cell wall-anchored protein
MPHQHRHLLLLDAAVDVRWSPTPRQGLRRPAGAVAILAQVRTPRWLATCMLLLGALALAVPAVTLASGGGSAGDQQYTDPFGGTTTSATHTTTSAPPATSSPSPSPTPTTSATPVASTQTSSSDPTAPTATIASSTAGQLPRTGYDSWLAAALGFALVAGGLALRVRIRRA